MNKIKMQEALPEERKKNFSEVSLGYTKEEAVNEAKRCIQCKKASCIEGCPVEINIPKFIKEITLEQFDQSIKTLKEKNNLPAICGRVCPQETQCELKCVLNKKGNPISIGSLERFAADWEMNNLKSQISNSNSKISNFKSPISVAVIGSGPAGLACAGDLARAGCAVTIFEALHEPGGVLTYGIPPFRLPRNILSYEIEYIKSLGVEILPNIVIGKTLTIDELFAKGFKAVFIGSGAGLPMFPGIPGENLCMIYSANEFLTRINLMKAYNFPEYDTPLNSGAKTAVIGGGNTAMDAARCALRLGKGAVTVVYRRTEEEMPARKAEIEHAKEEGIKFEFLTQPIEFLGDENGFVKGLKCIKCELGSADSSGRRRPVPIKGSEFIIDIDTSVLAIGLKPNPLIPLSTYGLKQDKEGNISVNPQTMETSLKNIYAGGDIVGGEGTVIEALGLGKKAAKSIIESFIK
ncbi:MAG: NADPH-dependent glutamate synthase [Elusimicrobia bacterium]|nr:NADPH-dependent glutamate synthase [Elusimicrobiota bacterium]MBU2614347.1 NADPH-dependent glutamate synthase [Elusimicrobiota bacterium]